MSDEGFIGHYVPTYVLPKYLVSLAVVVAQLVEWSLPTSEIFGSNPDISKKYIILVFRLSNGARSMALISQKEIVGPEIQQTHRCYDLIEVAVRTMRKI